ncbi:exodeoxyribonuclease VII small subunit [Arcanobacterium pinnipediorum]|uniref:Exodeoxyribonuclease 7 small subunit n=1 Tax=Arcanobacterium pinnipediorum TaxID=1503041 RepID=A0ABY5AGJ1_9ACTO|nr:exodeoxyribonuclease VII small subunit [Arcanobacterium pinnipediorum]USR79192.1 exodeoxyribonuclease VII small subunit [Arcanobacterium pinnipediorum]
MNPRDPQELDAQVATLSYEEARTRLVDTVARLEQGNIPLEEALELWELGEALARRCESWLAGARERLAHAQEQTRAVLDTDPGDN